MSYLNEERTQELIDEVKRRIGEITDIEYGVTAVRSGSKTRSFTLNQGETVDVPILFDAEMPDTDYILSLNTSTPELTLGYKDVTVNGFTATVISSAPITGVTAQIDYFAAKLYSVADIDGGKMIEEIKRAVGGMAFTADTRSGVLEETVTLNTGESTEFSVIFDSALADADYVLDLNCDVPEVAVNYKDKASSGFTVVAMSSAPLTDADISITYAAARFSKTSELDDRLVMTDALPTASADLVDETRLLVKEQTGYTLGGIYQCQETDTDIYEWVLISSADVDLSDYATTFVGTQDEWDALTDDEKQKYAIANITDDEVSDVNTVIYVDAPVTIEDNSYVSPFSAYIYTSLSSLGYSDYHIVSAIGLQGSDVSMVPMVFSSSTGKGFATVGGRAGSCTVRLGLVKD